MNRIEEIRRIKEISIINFLKTKFNLKPEWENNNYAVYYSPIRKMERTPSFFVYKNKNDFYDYGAKIGGSIIDLHMNIYNLKYTTTIKLLRDEYIYNNTQKN